MSAAGAQLSILQGVYIGFPISTAVFEKCLVTGLEAPEEDREEVLFCIYIIGCRKPSQAFTRR